MKKKYWWIIIIAILGIAGLLWWRSASPMLKRKAEKLTPKVKVVSISITDIRSERIKSTLWITLTNPLPVEIRIPKLDYNVFIDSEKVIESAYNKPVHIQPLGNSRIVLPMETLKGPMESILKRFDLQNRDSADYTFNVAFTVDIPIAGQKQFKIHENKRMPAVRLPRLKIEDVDIDKLGFDESVLKMQVRVENPSLFEFQMKNAGYSLSVDKDLEVEGNVEKVIDVPARGSQSIPMALDIRTAKIGKLTWKILFEKKHTDFKMDFYGTIISPDYNINNSLLTTSTEGTLYDLKKLKKK